MNWHNKLECLFLASFSSKAGAYQSKAILRGSILALAPVLIRNYYTRLARLDWGKHSSLFVVLVGDEEKSFLTLTPGPNVIKLFTSVIYEYS